jgi:ABC-2 type transport system permease protein
MQAAMLSTYLPSLLLSGFMFSIASMPVALRTFTYLVPARYYIVITRGIFLKDVGISVLWAQGAALVAYSLVGLALATATFKKKIA